MPRILWPLRHDQPTIEVVLSLAATGQEVIRHLLADTGAGTLWHWLVLVREELLSQTSRGTKGTPYRYGLPGREATPLLPELPDLAAL